MPILYTPPIYHPPIIETSLVNRVMIDDIEAIEKNIINNVLCSKQGYVLIKVGTYTLSNAKANYEVPAQALGKIMLDVGKIGIATKFVMSELIPGVDKGTIYLLATNDPKNAALLREGSQTKIF